MNKDLRDIVNKEFDNDFDKFIQAEVLNEDYYTTRSFIEDLYFNDLYMNY